MRRETWKSLLLSSAILAMCGATATAGQSSAPAPRPPAAVAAGRVDWTAAVEHYAAITAALAADKTDGVAAHATELSKLLGPIAAGQQQDSAAAQHRAALVAATKLSDAALTLDRTREAYKALSEALVPLANQHYVGQPSDPAWAVFYCPMAPGSWIQTGDVPANPYYGAKMLKCGAKQGMLGSSGPDDPQPARKSAAGGHEHGTGGHGA